MTVKLLEKHVSKQVVDFLRAHGWRAVRTQFAFAPGSFTTGEPGMPDWCFIRYMPVDFHPSRALVMWVEVKGPNDQRKCRCGPGERKPCKVCRQHQWQDRERARGAVVVVVSDLDWFIAEYEKAFGFLHRDEPRAEQDRRARQLELL